MITVLTGATGFIGTRLIRRLQRDDHQVRIVTRQPRRCSYNWNSMTDAVEAAAVIHGDHIERTGRDPVPLP